ncbi:MAG: SusC/RagA family TonB-linked outer membrane protein [Cyclobacteriaceae bacterium]|nr:SusC/RagA family TonB-linked outer membrane protein [Cyclobacteriaceae bacterium]
MLKYSTRLLVVPCMVLMISLTAFGQERTVTGKVSSSEDGLTLPGVNVVVKGTSTGTMTDASGNYSIQVPSSAVLVFSYVGYSTQEVTVGSNTVVDVILQFDAKTLSEVVVTAFGLEQQKKALGFAVQEVKGDEILQSRESNIVDALNAKIAGVQVVRQGGSAGAGSSILIRGTSSVSGNNQPLFVVDGIPINNSFRASIGTSSGVDYANRAIDLNPNDIESVSVLKGPAATALYGIQGGNGVILITTKKGMAAAKGFTVDFSTNFSTDIIMNYFPQQDLYSQGDNGIFSGGTTFNHYGAPMSTIRYDPNTPNVKDPNGTIVDMNHPNAGPRVPVYNNQEEFFQNGFTNDTYLAVSSKTDKSSVYLSVGNMFQQGIIPNNTFNRTSIKLSSQTKFNDKFSMSGSVTYANSKSTKFGRGDNFSDAIQGLYRTPPSFRNADGYVYPSGVQRNFRGAVDGSAPFSPDNPLWTVNNNPYDDNVNRFISYLQVDYKPLEWLSFLYRAGYDFSDDDRTQRWAPSSAGGSAISSSGTLGGRMYEDSYVDKIFNSDFIVTARKKISDKIEGSLMVGHNLYSLNNSNTYLNGTNFAIPGLYTITNTQEDPVFLKNRFEKQTQAIYTRLNLSYANSIFLELSGRNEWSSTLPEATRSFPYGSAALSVVFSEFLNLNEDIFSFGKIKGSMAVTGNDAPIYRTETFYVIGTTSTRYAGGVRFPIDGVGGSLLSRAAGNSNLKAETNTTSELGFDLRFLKNRVGLDLTFYKSLSRDQIISVPVPGSTGFTTQIVNSGEIENRGIEMVINATPVKAGDFSWDLIFNFTRNRNYVNALPNDEPIVYNLFGARIQSRLIPGEQYGIFYGNAFKRNENGDLLINTSGYPQVDPTGQKMVGNPNPDYLIGFRNVLNYKRFNLSFLWDIRKGGDVVNVTAFWMGNGSGVAEHTEDRNNMVIYKGIIDNPGGDNDGQVNNIPALLNQAAFAGTGAAFAVGRELTERWVQDGSWIRLRDVSLNYSIPQAVVGKIGMTRANVGVYGRNLLLFTNYGGIDPETNLAGPNSVVGLDAFTTPNMRSYGITLTASF